MGTCFAIMPIGKPDSDVRKHSDKVYRHIIKKALEENNPPYHCIRADEVSRPNNIIRDVVQHLYDADVVIADLTDQNPNVFYEVGVTHAVGQNLLPIIQGRSRIPFDLHDEATIRYADSEDGLRKLQEDILEIMRNY